MNRQINSFPNMYDMLQAKVDCLTFDKVLILSLNFFWKLNTSLLHQILGEKVSRQLLALIFFLIRDFYEIYESPVCEERVDSVKK